jgi:hypothetical protein
MLQLNRVSFFVAKHLQKAREPKRTRAATRACLNIGTNFPRLLFLSRSIRVEKLNPGRETKKRESFFKS